MNGSSCELMLNFSNDIVRCVSVEGLRCCPEDFLFAVDSVRPVFMQLFIE